MATTSIEKIEPIEKALTRLRYAPLEMGGGEDIYVYRNATMRLCDFLADELNPTSLYILKNHIESLQQVRKDLLSYYQIDILQLSSILHLRTSNGQLIGMAPPVVEIYEEDVNILPLPGDLAPPQLSLKIPIIKDGIHRAWIAREEHVSLRCILICGALRNYRPYAYPNTWSQVQICDSKPAEKKFYRRSDHYSFLRPIKVLRQTGDTPPPSEWGR